MVRRRRSSARLARAPFFFSRYGDHPDLHSFPTRRSSDLQASRVMHEALSRFVRVAQGARDLPPELPDDTLLAACELIGQRIGVAFRAPPKRAQPVFGIDRLDRKSTRLNSSH